MSEPALQVEDLHHSFGPRTVLNSVSFTIPQGAFTVLLGPNGAGKTTLFALITRLYHPTRGRIAVAGRGFADAPTAALAQMGVVFQQPTLDLDLTVAQNLRYHAALHGLPTATARHRIEAELARIGLLDRARDRVRSLSGGQRRRVELARALLHEPSLLLLDEPTAGLDPDSRRQLLEHTRTLCTARGMAVLWATHLIDEADANATVIVLDSGQIKAEGGTAQIIAQTGTDGLPAAFRHLTKRAA